MRTIPNPLIRRLRAFAEDRSGAAAVEFALWLPMLVAVIMLAADATALFRSQSHYWDVSRETARIVARHALDATDGAHYAAGRLNSNGYTPDVDVAIDPSNQIVTVVVRGDAERLAPFGVLRLALGERIEVRVSQALEPI